MTDHAFVDFGKIARLSREITVTEKIDGTNGVVFIADDGYTIRFGSRSRWLSLHEDNFGFWKWCNENTDDLLKLGPGFHYGEWWGLGIQRNYAQPRKRFSLFNTHRWTDDRPTCCDVVPILYQGPFDNDGVLTGVQSSLRQLREQGSVASPGFMNPEGIIVWHSAAQTYFKKTLHKDDARPEKAGR